MPIEFNKETISLFIYYLSSGNYKSAQDLISNELKLDNSSVKEFQDKFNDLLMKEMVKPVDFYGISEILDDYPTLKNFLIAFSSSFH